MKPYRIALSVLLVVVAFLLLTNPSEKSFESYARVHVNYRLITARHSNYYVASVYVAQTGDYEYYYFGIAGNFFEIDR